MAITTSSWLCVCIVLCTLMLDIAQGWRTPALTPPDGNSLKMKTIAKNGKYIYRCQKGSWMPVLATADLANISNITHLEGKYTLAFKSNRPAFMGIWYLNNGDGFMSESGHAVSIVSAHEISTETSDYSDALPQVLAEASYHENYGVATQISYIQRLFTKGGLPPSGKCSTPNAKIEVPFKAQFWFYTQDVVPPSLPESIKCPGRMVMGFYCKGVATYTFNGTSWKRTAITGKLYNVPGGNFLGTYYQTKQPDKVGGNFCLETNDPYGWSLTAKAVASSGMMQPDALPWTLFKVTTSKGNTQLLGPFSYFQMVGTRGGVPPTPSKKTPVGATYRSSFCNQFWVMSPQ